MLSHFLGFSQNPVLIGYWQNWNDANAPYIPLDQIDSRYDVVCVSFGEPVSPSDMTMVFVPETVSESTFNTQIQALQGLGKKVLLSIGGANTSISLPDLASRDVFINSMNSLLDTYSFDGIDIDIEHGNSILASGTIANPSSADCLNLIEAIRQIKSHFLSVKSHDMMLTFAPETAYVQGGMSAYGGIWGGYLPILDALRNDINYIHVQLYNSGSVYGIDGGIYTQASADFIVAMSEALIQGFNTSGGNFAGFSANKVVVGLPACSSAAGGGFTSTEIVQSAIHYLRGTGNQPGNYVLTQTAGYPDLGGMMTWSINWDAVNSCNVESYEYAQNFESLFGSIQAIENAKTFNNTMNLFPNPTSDFIQMNSTKNQNYYLYNSLGKCVKSGHLNANEKIDIRELQAGIYQYRSDEFHGIFIKKE